MIDGGQTGRGDGRGKDVVKAADRNIARNTDAAGGQLGQNAQGSHVVNADERGGIAATADELGGQSATDVVLVGHVGESVGLGAAFGGEHLKTIPNSMEFQLPADALQALAARQGELIEGGGDKDQPAVAQLAQMLGQQRACGHIAQLNGAYAQLILLFPDEHRGQGVGCLLYTSPSPRDA